MDIALIELPARFGHPEIALQEVETLLSADGSTKPDLVLLSETALTGYVSASGDYDLKRFAEPLWGSTTQAISEMGKRFDCAIAAPLIERDGERCFNAFVVLSKRGELIAHYRKRNPWYPETWATAGDLPMPIFELMGIRLSMAICFDVHFLKQEQHPILSSIDCLLFPTAWVDEDEDDQRGPILASLASRYRITIANANWGLGNPRIEGQGSSRFVSERGELSRLGAPTLDGRFARAQRLDGSLQGAAKSTPTP